MPGATKTIIHAIDGSNLAGMYYDSSGGVHGFLYDGTDWTTIDVPGATITSVWGIDNDNLVGNYLDSDDKLHGYLYDGTDWITIDAPGASRTCVYGIDGNKLVGDFRAGGFHGFLYEIPEPATLLLLTLGAIMLRKK